MRTITITDLQRKPKTTIEYIASSVEPVVMRRPKGRHIAIEAISACNRRIATIKWLSELTEVEFILKSLVEAKIACYRTFRKIGLSYYVTTTCQQKYEQWFKHNSAQVRRIMLLASRPRASTAIPLLGVLKDCHSLSLGFEQTQAILYMDGPDGPVLLDIHSWQAGDGQALPWAL